MGAGFAKIPLIEQRIGTPQAPSPARGGVAQSDSGLDVSAKALEEVAQLSSRFARVVNLQNEHQKTLDTASQEEVAKNKLLPIYMEAQKLKGTEWGSHVKEHGQKAIDEILANPANSHIQAELRPKLTAVLGTLTRQAEQAGVHQAAQDQHVQQVQLGKSLASESGEAYILKSDGTFADSPAAIGSRAKYQGIVNTNWGNNPEKAAAYMTAFDRDKAMARGLTIVRKNPEGMEGFLAGNNLLEANEKLTLSTSARAQVEHRAALVRQEEEKRRVEFASYVGEKARDDTAAFLDGKTPGTVLTAHDFASAYKYGAERRYEDYESARHFGAAMEAVAVMPPEKQAELLKRSEPVPGLGYEAKSRMHDALTRAVTSVNSARAKDPINFASRYGLADIKPLAFNDPNALKEQIAEREKAAFLMNEHFETPLALFTKPEVTALASSLERMPSGAKAQFLKTLHGSTRPEMYRAALQQIRPDSPVTAFAGGLMDKTARISTGTWWTPASMGVGDVAGRILEGEALLNPTAADKKLDGKPKFVMPEENDLRMRWADQVGDAYRGAPQTEDTAYQAFRAYYAAEAARQGKYSKSLDNTIADQAAHAVSGGVTDVNGKNVVLPWGMDESAFHDSLAVMWPGVLARAGLPKDLNVGSFSLDTVGDGRYAVISGTGPLRDKEGRPVIVNVGNEAGR